MTDVKDLARRGILTDTIDDIAENMIREMERLNLELTNEQDRR